MSGDPAYHRVSVERPVPGVYKFSCSCGVVLYNGTDSLVGEKYENRHIRENLGGYQPPRGDPKVDWDHVGTWFLLGWLLSD